MESVYPDSQDWTPDAIVDAIIHGLANGEVINSRVETYLLDGRTVFRCHAPGDVVPPVDVTSTSDEVRWNALKVFTALMSQEQRYRAMPDCRSRRERRDAARKASGQQPGDQPGDIQCPRCKGYGGRTDLMGNWHECAVCSGAGLV